MFLHFSLTSRMETHFNLGEIFNNFKKQYLILPDFISKKANK